MSKPVIKPPLSFTLANKEGKDGKPAIEVMDIGAEENHLFLTLKNDTNTPYIMAGLDGAKIADESNLAPNGPSIFYLYFNRLLSSETVKSLKLDVVDFEEVPAPLKSFSPVFHYWTNGVLKSQKLARLLKWGEFTPGEILHFRDLVTQVDEQPAIGHQRFTFTDTAVSNTLINSSDGKKFAFLPSGESGYSIWSTDDFKKVKSLMYPFENGPNSLVVAATFSHNSNEIAILDLQGRLVLWNISSGEEAVAPSCDGLDDPIGIAYAADGRYILVVNAGEQPAIFNYDIDLNEWGQPTFLGGTVDDQCPPAFSPDRNRIACVNDDGEIQIWNAGSGKLHLNLKTDATVLCMVFSPNGSLFTAGFDDNVVRVWDTENGRSNPLLRGHTNSINCVTFSPDGTRILSGSDDGTVLIWDATSGGRLARLAGNSPAREDEYFDSWASLAVLPDGRIAGLGMVSNHRCIYVWNPDDPSQFASSLNKHLEDACEKLAIRIESRYRAKRTPSIHYSAHDGRYGAYMAIGFADDWYGFGSLTLRIHKIEADPLAHTSYVCIDYRNIPLPPPHRPDGTMQSKLFVFKLPSNKIIEDAKKHIEEAKAGLNGSIAENKIALITTDKVQKELQSRATFLEQSAKSTKTTLESLQKAIIGEDQFVLKVTDQLSVAQKSLEEAQKASEQVTKSLLKGEGDAFALLKRVQKPPLVCGFRGSNRIRVGETTDNQLHLYISNGSSEVDSLKAEVLAGAGPNASFELAFVPGEGKGALADKSKFSSITLAPQTLTDQWKHSVNDVGGVSWSLAPKDIKSMLGTGSESTLELLLSGIPANEEGVTLLYIKYHNLKVYGSGCIALPIEKVQPVSLTELEFDKTVKLPDVTVSCTVQYATKVICRATVPGPSDPDSGPLRPQKFEKLLVNPEPLTFGPVRIDGTTTFTITAFNEDNGESATQEITVSYPQPPIGTVMMWWGREASLPIPPGWAPCDGGLHSGIQTPDLRGRFVIGANDNHRRDTYGGDEKVTLTLDQIPAHKHSGSTNIAGSHSHMLQQYHRSFMGDGGSPRLLINENDQNFPTPHDGDHSHEFTTNPAGGNQDGSTISHENMPPFRAVEYIIRVQ